MTKGSFLRQGKKVQIMTGLDKDNGVESKESLVTRVLLFAVLPLMTISSIVFGVLYFSATGESQNIRQSGYSIKNGNMETQTIERIQLEAVYVPIEPAFVVNFEGQGKAQFLQISIELMTRSSDMAEKIRHHIPVIRNNLTMLFSDQDYDKISTLEGKEALRKKALDTIQEILVRETGKRGVEAVYFTSFVMQ